MLAIISAVYCIPLSTPFVEVLHEGNSLQSKNLQWDTSKKDKGSGGAEMGVGCPTTSPRPSLTELTPLQHGIHRRRCQERGTEAPLIPTVDYR